ncbi:tubulin-tyrosine ligase/Tubulin polyglutamylase [Lactifluus subvellereus]|nr:tubulin-tyrosine ligase/Tubulin polyglutamylase [Lactifluus subvellereus]
MMDQSQALVAFVLWPSAPLTDSLKIIQWSTYDEIDHTLVYADRNDVLSSSYVIRKALIRKHFLSRCIYSYLTKHPDSVLRIATPKTWEIEITFADELDDLWADELWDLSDILEKSIASPETGDRWWILKPGMADRGMGIRLFNSKQSLQQILDEFDDDGLNGDGDDGNVVPDDSENDTSIAISQLRHFVIQEYLSKPLLVDPHELTPGGDPSRQLEGHKFHLRSYCVASGDLTLYLYTRILALFSSKPYSPPSLATDRTVDLAPHLTNSSLQTERREEGVRLLDELVGCHVLSGGVDMPTSTLTLDHLATIQDQMADTLAETFKAALQSPIHFQPLANAFELYGVDFLVEHAASQFQVKLLEINAEPAIELTGPRLTWILEDLFRAIAHVCVDPFVRDGPVETWPVGQTKHNLKKCLQTKVRGS